MLDWLNFILFVLLMLLKAFVHTMFRFNPLQQSIFERSVVPLNCYSTQQANMSTYSHYSLGFQQGLGSSGLYSFSSLLVCLFFQEWFNVRTIIQQYTVCSGGSLFPCFSAPDIICHCGDHIFKPPKKPGPLHVLHVHAHANVYAAPYMFLSRWWTIIRVLAHLLSVYFHHHGRHECSIFVTGQKNGAANWQEQASHVPCLWLIQGHKDYRFI